MIKIYKLITEWKQATDEEYFKCVEDFYNKSFANGVRQGEQSAPNLLITTLKTDGDNLIIRYMEDKNTIYVLGLVSKQGELKKSDMSDLKKLNDEFLVKLNNGKDLLTYPNDISELFIDRLIKEGEKRGIKLVKEKEGSHSFGNANVDPKFLNYKMVRVYKE